MRTRAIFLCATAFILGAIAIVAVALVVYLEPDVVTVIAHPAQPAYETYEHSRDRAGYFLLGAGFLAGIGIGVAWLGINDTLRDG